MKFFNRNEEEQSFIVKPDSEGLNFVISPDDFEKCKQLNGANLLQEQFIYLQMLEEQEIAEAIPNGYCVLSDQAVRLGDVRELFDLPPIWPGKFSITTKNLSSDSSFEVTLRIIDTKGDHTVYYNLNGPYLYLGETEQYFLNAAQLHMLQAVDHFKNLEDLKKGEYENLLLIQKLQEAKNSGVEIDLSHFNELDVINPEKVAISIQEDDEGNWNLTPIFGQKSDAKEIEIRLGQLNPKFNAQSLRVGNEFILLDKKKLDAVHEIITKKVIPKDQIRDFIKSPTAFIDASMVDLDSGFAVRVKGIGQFKHAYFGDTDASELDWFNAGVTENETVEPHELHKIIKDHVSLDLFKDQLEEATKQGAEEMLFEGKSVNISDKKEINSILNRIGEKIDNESSKPSKDSESKTNDRNINVLEIETNDEVLAGESPKIEKEIQEIQYKGKLHFDQYLRQPYPHQETGIRWLLGLMCKNETFSSGRKCVQGGLLADDMGLGKTYMALVGINEYYKFLKEQDKTLKPILIVAPLSLLEIWKCEVDLTYKYSPFSDIVILQSDADLNRFKEKGAGVEIRQQNGLDKSASSIEKSIRYSLKLGKKYGLNRLDLPQRLILTTYQTLRDYQFSLCRIDWSVVIFDEAQNIKNPNALQTRSAKALKAQFKLLATGTPVENHLGDFWCLFDTLQQGQLGTYQEFRKRYIEPINNADKESVGDIRNSVGRILREDAGALMLRRVKEDNLTGLPEKRIFAGLSTEMTELWQYKESIKSVLEKDQRSVYDSVLNAVHDLNVAEGDKRKSVLPALMQLRDASLHPGLVDKGELAFPKNPKELKEFIFKSSKLKSVFYLLDEIKAREEKVIIFAINTRLQRFLSLVLSKLFGEHVKIINGKTKAIQSKGGKETRLSIIKEFEEKPGYAALIMSPIAAGTGLTITKANNVIHLERHWNPAKEAQATDRVYRIGQKKDVNVYIPIVHHPECKSFDVNLHELLSRKTSLKDAVITPEEVDLSNMDAFPDSQPEKKIEIKDVLELPWEHFEALIAELFNRFEGNKAMMTAVSNDRGCDVVVIKEDGENILIQCKHTSKESVTGEGPVRELLAAPSYYKDILNKQFDKLMVISNAKNFSSTTKDAARRENVQLCGYKEIKKWLAETTVYYSDIFKRLNQSKTV
jgi:SNF2 family DNA or RNA helicase